MSDFDLAAFKQAFEADKSGAINDDFWKAFESQDAWSLWRCTYDYADDTESLDAAKEIVSSFMNNTKPVTEKCFGVMHVLEPGLKVEGLWLFQGPDPELLFGTNEDTSWFTWNQLGPSMTDGAKKEVIELFTATSEYKGKTVSHTHAM